MKKRLSLVVLAALVMVMACFAGFAATAAVAPADTTKDIGIMLANNIEYEGVTVIHTTGNFNSAWRAAALFELDPATGAYMVKAVYAGGATGPDWTIDENQFVVESNIGNNWPSLVAAATGTEWWYGSKNMQDVPYDECPNFINDKNNAWNNIIKSLVVGDLYTLVGIDLENPVVNANYAVDANYDYITHNDEYETYSYLTPYGGAAEKDLGIAVGKSYTKSGMLEDNYPDTDDAELTDGIIPTDPGYGNAQLTGFNANSPDYQANGYAEVVIDLEEVAAITRINMVVSNLQSAGIGAPAEVKYFISADNDTWTEVGVGAYDVDPFEKDGDTFVNGNKIVNNSIAVTGSARYVKVQFKHSTGNAWMFVGEIQVFGEAEEPAESSAPASSEETSTGGTPGTGDNGFVVLAVIAVISLAGAVIVRRK